jgi:hypothetical protein
MLYHTPTTAPAPLPFRIRLSDGRTRTDPATFTAEEIADAGYIEAPAKPDHDPATERVVWQAEIADWAIEPLPAPPEPKPRDLTRVEFVRLCMGAGGMTQEMLVQARQAPELAAMWIMLEMAEKVSKDDPEIGPGLAALENLGHLPNGAQAVLDVWPTA